MPVLGGLAEGGGAVLPLPGVDGGPGAQQQLGARRMSVGGGEHQRLRIAAEVAEHLKSAKKKKHQDRYGHHSRS
jgi:hypothetical protein